MPLCWCSAPPSSYVERDAYERVAGAMLDDLAAHGAAAGGIDGIYLDLHGAMVAEHYDDGEGELLAPHSRRWSATGCRSSPASTTTPT